MKKMKKLTRVLALIVAGGLTVGAALAQSPAPAESAKPADQPAKLSKGQEKAKEAYETAKAEYDKVLGELKGCCGAVTNAKKKASCDRSIARVEETANKAAKLAEQKRFSKAFSQVRRAITQCKAVLKRCEKTVKTEAPPSPAPSAAAAGPSPAEPSPASPPAAPSASPTPK